MKRKLKCIFKLCAAILQDLKHPKNRPPISLSHTIECVWERRTSMFLVLDTNLCLYMYHFIMKNERNSFGDNFNYSCWIIFRLFFYFRPFEVFLCKVSVKLLRFYQMTSYPPWSLPWQGDKGVIWDCIWDLPNLYHSFVYRPTQKVCSEEFDGLRL